METNCLGRNLFSDMRNTYIDDVRKFYAKIGDVENFERDLATYLLNGYVLATPRWIILGKPVRRDGGNPNAQWWDDETCCDAWYVKFAAGEGTFGEWVKAIPFKLPFIGWMRALKNKPVKFWDWRQVTRRN